MNYKPILLIIAAGMGSRYEDLKQNDPVDPNGEMIADYSRYDKVRVGIKKVVFTIHRYFEETFREKIESRLDGIVETIHACQEPDSRSNGFAPDISDPLQRQVSVYLQEHGHANKSKFYIPIGADRLVHRHQKTVKIKNTHNPWFGITYREEKITAQSCIRKLTEQNVYPANLWSIHSSGYFL